MTSCRRLLLVGGKDSGFKSLAEMDIDITLLQDRANLSRLQLDRADTILLMPKFSDVNASALAAACHATQAFDAVVAFNEYRLDLASRLGERFGVVHNPLTAVRQTRNKLLMRRILGKVALPVRYALCERLADLSEFVNSIGQPAVLKPLDGSGSRGLAYIPGPAGITSAWTYCTRHSALPVLAEEFLPGQEYSVEALTLRGRHQILAITEKVTTGPPSFIEVGHALPARLDPRTASTVETMVVDVLEAVGHWWGPSHTEVMVSEDGKVNVVETHTRFGGDQIWEMVEVVCGVRLAEATVTGMLGIESASRPPSGALPRSAAAAIRFLCLEDGIVGTVGDFSAATEGPGIIRVSMNLREGQVLGYAGSSSDRQGYVLAIGDSTEVAVERAECALRALGALVELRPRAGCEQN